MKSSGEYDLVVVGSGAAGLTAALESGDNKVLVITKTDSFTSGSSPLAQGGIAASVGSDDSPELHYTDTVKAGAFSARPEQVSFLTEHGESAIDNLLKINMEFDKTGSGSLDRNREGAHSRRRVLKAGGDATGRVLVETLYREAITKQNISWATETFVNNLIIVDGKIQGVEAYSRDKGWIIIKTTRVILATGGLGQLFGNTTNPVEATGDSMAIALRSGIWLKEVEMVQFHPTALNIKTGHSLRLLTEALRGDGAILVREDGISFMGKYSTLKDLAPRDVVSRGIWNEMEKGHKIFLDLSPIKDIKNKFPTVSSFCFKAGLNPKRDLIPVTPAVHYVMGGVDINSKTIPAGLGIAGEAAYTGVHGANRLASNSLLECLVYGKSQVEKVLQADHDVISVKREDPVVNILSEELVDEFKLSLQNIMYSRCGIIRTEEELLKGEAELEALKLEIEKANGIDTKGCSYSHVIKNLELNNMITLGLSLIRSAIYRKESRGAHYRVDYPETSIKWDRIKIEGEV